MFRQIKYLYDFSEVLDRFFTCLSKELDGLSLFETEKLILLRGEHIYYSLFWFCCKKGYFGFNEDVFSKRRLGDVLIIRKRSKHWNTNNTEDDLLCMELQRLYPSLKNYTQSSVSLGLSTLKYHSIFSGIMINSNENNQTFYLWECKVHKGVIDKNIDLFIPFDLQQVFVDYINIVSTQSSYPINVFFKEKGINPKTFQKMFRQRYDTSFYDFYSRYRLLRALELILFSSLPFKTIAYEVGYQNYRVFYKAFTDNQKLSPSDFRENNFL